MEIPWWYVLIAVYLAFSIYFSVAILKTQPGRGPGEKPLGMVTKWTVYASAFLVLLVIWPQAVLWDYRNRI
jgi:hypothetical protein